MTINICPTPYKKSFSSQEEAVSDIKRAYERTKTTLRTYKCNCGKFHLTHKEVK